MGRGGGREREEDREWNVPPSKIGQKTRRNAWRGGMECSLGPPVATGAKDEEGGIGDIVKVKGEGRVWMCGKVGGRLGTSSLARWVVFIPMRSETVCGCSDGEKFVCRGGGGNQEKRALVG